TRMDDPIGDAVGNAVEIAESVDVLRGGGPADTRALTVALGAEMLALAGVVADRDAGAARIERALDDGSALDLFRRMVEAQGGDPRVADAPAEVLPRARHRVPVPAPRAGYVTACAADEIGMAALVLGAGRRRKEDAVDPAVGVVMAVSVGDRVDAGAPLAHLLHNGTGAEEAARRVAAACTIGDEPPGDRPLVLEVLR
ncbi:MAG: thymidine phosphorylase, partial [Deltaproteobacteria bacterium]